jgi:hypothetical protein
MRKGYLIVSNGLGGDEGLTGFRSGARKGAAAEARQQQIPFGDDNKKSKGSNTKTDATAKGEIRGSLHRGSR